MSWSVSATIEGGSAADELVALREAALSQNSECGDQFDAAKDAAYMLVSSGVVGTPDKKYHITMTGHANPDHEPRSGWANDMITISISQA